MVMITMTVSQSAATTQLNLMAMDLLDWFPYIFTVAACNVCRAPVSVT